MEVWREKRSLAGTEIKWKNSLLRFSPGRWRWRRRSRCGRGQRLRRWRRAVWPDDGIKKWPNFGQKVATHFLHNSGIIRNSPKSHQNIWTTFVRQIVAKKLKKSPNLVTLTPWENAKLLGRSWQNCFVIENWTKFYRIYLTAVTDRKLDRLA